MATPSPLFVERSRKIEQVILAALAETGQAIAAASIGTTETAISRMKSHGDIKLLADLLAALDKKVVHENDIYCSEEELEALRVMARASRVLEKGRGLV